MKRIMFKSKIHRVVVTAKNVDYEGSISVDRELLSFADVLPYEKVHIWNVTNGERFVTYAIGGGKGEVSVNGSAAHRCNVGDLIIVASFSLYDERELADFKPKVVFVDENNCAK